MSDCRGSGRGYIQSMEIGTGLVLVIVTFIVLGELMTWLRHRKDVADPPSWN